MWSSIGATIDVVVVFDEGLFVLRVEGEGSPLGVGYDAAGEVVGITLPARESVIARRNGRVALLLRAAYESRRVRRVQVPVAVAVIEECLFPWLAAGNGFCSTLQSI